MGELGEKFAFHLQCITITEIYMLKKQDVPKNEISIFYDKTVAVSLSEWINV